MDSAPRWGSHRLLKPVVIGGRLLQAAVVLGLRHMLTDMSWEGSGNTPEYMLHLRVGGPLRCGRESGSFTRRG